MAFVYLFEWSELEEREGAPKLRDALDYGNTGTVTDAAKDRLRRDASSYVLEAYYGTFNVPPDVPAIPEGLKRLALDAARAYLTQEAPEVYRGDWERMFRWCKQEVDDLRLANRRTGAEPPDAALNIGGATGAIGSPNPCNANPVWESMNTNNVDW